ncbi:MAG TPA: DUF1592 domain-containing protein [Steroidobacteraceae bacterium]
MASAQAQPRTDQDGHVLSGVVEKYCLDCHNPLDIRGDLILDRDFSLPEDSALWEKVVGKLRMRAMPPRGKPRPSDQEYRSVIGFLESRLDQSELSHPDFGRPLLHRLNRTEYANVIHDLLALDVNVEESLPPDDSAFGFDNNAGALTLSPALLEGYLSAADQISSLALGDMETQAAQTNYRVRLDLSQDQHIEGLPFGTVGGMKFEHVFPLDGEYELSAHLMRSNLEFMRGVERPHQVEMSIDGVRVFLGTVGGPDDLASQRNPTNGSDAIDARLRVRVPVKAGAHDVVVTFVQERASGTERLQGFVRSSVDTLESVGRPHLDTVSIKGPYNPSGPGETASRAKVLICRPPEHSGKPEELTCARQILGSLATRAYRRPVTDEDMAPLMEFYERGRKKGSFEAGIQMGLRRILASPTFIFRPETDPDGLAPGAVHRVSDLELASRLSFFLWSSIPDDELIRLAVAGDLHKPEVLRAQARRMLDDPKSERLVENFAGQWLRLRNLKLARPNSATFPNFDDNLRTGFRRETELLFASVLNENRSVLDLLRADYTFVDERLAKHYGIPGVYGSQFRRVPITDKARLGILGQGSILTVTSHADRTSPVVRGKWVLENLLGAPPPPPPPNVPALPDNGNAELPKTLRARLELHRANPVCAGCHAVMDPIGFALDNFDAVGVWRSEDAGQPINAHGTLVDGTEVDGVVSLRNALLARPEVFVSTVTEKLLIYALGRGTAPSDMAAIRNILRDTQSGDYKLSSLVMGIVESAPFQMKVKAEEAKAKPEALKVKAEEALKVKPEVALEAARGG